MRALLYLPLLASIACVRENPAFELAEGTQASDSAMADTSDLGSLATTDADSSEQASDLSIDTATESTTTTTTDSTVTSTTQDTSTTTSSGSDTATSSQSSGSDSTSSSTTALECPSDLVIEFDITMATVVAPMIRATDPRWAFEFIRPGMTQDGHTVLPFTLDCLGRFSVWAKVLDSWPGVHSSDDPDSFFVGFDQEQRATWIYGCDFSSANSSAHWEWHEVHHWPDDQSCQSLGFNTYLEPGDHELIMQTREPITPDNLFPAFYRVVITTDPAFDPSSIDP